tara:strand:+ start:1801 stop:2469 length:669 start_codon:yes stop_codon:yes gene_type:complete
MSNFKQRLKDFLRKNIRNTRMEIPKEYNGQIIDEEKEGAIDRVNTLGSGENFEKDMGLIELNNDKKKHIDGKSLITGKEVQIKCDNKSNGTKITHGFSLTKLSLISEVPEVWKFFTYAMENKMKTIAKEIENMNMEMSKNLLCKLNDNCNYHIDIDSFAESIISYMDKKILDDYENIDIHIYEKDNKTGIYYLYNNPTLLFDNITIGKVKYYIDKGNIIQTY